MTGPAILLRRPKKVQDAQFWLCRAEQARRVATMLSARDAALAEAFAAECEAAAQGPKAATPIAA